MSHQSGVLTAFPQRLKNAGRRGARCANASNAVETLWEHCAIAKALTMYFDNKTNDHKMNLNKCCIHYNKCSMLTLHYTCIKHFMLTRVLFSEKDLFHLH